jgi:hypothetical protein
MESNNSTCDVAPTAQTAMGDEVNLLSPLLRRKSQVGSDGAITTTAMALGELLALVDDGITPLIRLANQPQGRATIASSIVELHGRLIGSKLLIGFIENDRDSPVVLGVLTGHANWSTTESHPQVEVDADGKRLFISAREELVLRCGKASITLTKAGKVLVDGTYVSVHSTGVHRIKGGSIELN